MVSVEWTVQPTPLELHFTIDGVTITHTFTNPVSTANYSASLSESTAATAQYLIVIDTHAPFRPFLYEGKSIKVEAETTGGTTQNLVARVKYAKW